MHDAGIAVAVVMHDDSVLVGRRNAAAAEAADLYEFPGGKVENGETVTAAALREVREETGLDVRIGAVLDTATAPSHAGPIEIAFLAAEPIDAAMPPRPPFAWVPIERLVHLPFPAANRRVLERLRGGLRWRAAHGGS